MKFYHILKRWDWIVLTLLLMLSFLPSVVFSYQQANVSEDAEMVAVISVENEEVGRFTLTGHEGTEILDIPEIPCDTNTVEVQDEHIRIKSSTCPEQICVLTGYVSRPGETVICLHHKMVIEVEAVGGGFTEDVLISY